MKLVVGLGNPGKQYELTRHNIGFLAVDFCAKDATWKLWGTPKNSELCEISLEGEKVYLQKPITYMNLSGQAAAPLAHFYKITPENIVVIHDDVDLPFGSVRLKVGGGNAGHNGLKSLDASLGTNNYSRIRMGVGRSQNPREDTGDFVLSPFRNDEWQTVEDMLARSLQAVRAFAKGPDVFRQEMNTLNRKV